MYVLVGCNGCGQKNFVDIEIEAEKQGQFYKMVSVDVRDTSSYQDLANRILMKLREHIYNGITVKKLCKLLEAFGIMEQYCCDFIQLIKLEYCMYCPDRHHLYFVEGKKQNLPGR